jgi:hypothetical protein
VVGRSKTHSKSDDARFDALSEIGCLACNVNGWPCVPCQANHLLQGYRFEDEHRHTVGLCGYHHQGYPLPICCTGSKAEAERTHGPNLRDASKAFHARYGSDAELLAIEDAAIRIVQSARRRGRYLPSREISKAVRELHREIVGKSGRATSE